MHISEKDFGQGFHLITLENSHQTTLSVTDLGARITSLRVADRELVLGFDSATEYINKDPYIGASIGRVAGRIENGTFDLAGQTYHVQTDPQTKHTLHGAAPSFELAKWQYETENQDDQASVIFHLESPDQEHGFPGNLAVTVRYTLTEDDQWHVQTTGLSDQTTLFNPTNHVYFNLTGDVTQSVADHQLYVASSAFAQLRSDSIPTGKKIAVANTPFDFQTPKTIGDALQADFEQKNQFDGIDHPFFLNPHTSADPVATLTSPDQKIHVDVMTDASSLVIFTANFGDATPDMHGAKLANHGGITFETQTAPGAEKYPEFGSMELLAHTPYTTTTTFKLY